MEPGNVTHQGIAFAKWAAGGGAERGGPCGDRQAYFLSTASSRFLLAAQPMLGKGVDFGAPVRRCLRQGLTLLLERRARDGSPIDLDSGWGCGLLFALWEVGKPNQAIEQ